MRCKTFAHLRVVILLVAFGIGLLGQTIAAVAMPMQMLQGVSHIVCLGGSTDGSGTCPGCAQQQDLPANHAMGANCAFALCSLPLAVLPSGPIVARAVCENIQLIALRGNTGIILRPNLGPPRSILHS